MGTIIKPFRGTLLNKTHPLAKGLVGCWLFNEGNGGIVYDLVTRINTDGTINGSAWVPNGLYFNGDDWVVARVIDNLPTTEVTIFMYYKADATALESGLFGIDIYTLDTTRLIQSHAPWSDNNIYWDFGGSSSGTSRLAVAMPSGWLGNKHYIAYRAKTGSGQNIWADGSELASHSGNTPTRVAGGNFWFGRTRTAAGISRYHSNDIYFVYVYNQWLADDILQWLYREPYAMFEQPSKAKYFYVAPPEISIPVVMKHLREQRIA